MTLKFKYSRSRTILAVAACIAMGAGQRAYPQNKTGFDAYDGTWNLDLAKTDFGKTAPPKSVKLTITSTPTSRKWTQVSVGADGKSQIKSYNGAADDRFYPIKGGSDEATFAYRKDGSFAIKDKSGKVVQTTTYSLSAEGETMTLHTTFHTPDGEVTHVAVLQKEK